MLQSLRKLVTHFAAYFSMWKSINTRTSFLISMKHKMKTKYDLKTNVTIGDWSGGGGGSCAAVAPAAAAVVRGQFNKKVTNRD
jgi:hypothetical protein